MDCFGAVEKRKVQERESCFTVVLKFEFKAQVLMAFEHDCKLGGENSSWPSISPILVVSGKDHRKRTTETKVDQAFFLFKKIFSSKLVVSWLCLREGNRNLG